MKEDKKKMAYGGMSTKKVQKQPMMAKGGVVKAACGASVPPAQKKK